MTTVTMYVALVPKNDPAMDVRSRMILTTFRDRPWETERAMEKRLQLDWGDAEFLGYEIVPVRVQIIDTSHRDAPVRPVMGRTGRRLSAAYASVRDASDAVYAAMIEQDRLVDTVLRDVFESYPAECDWPIRAVAVHPSMYVAIARMEPDGHVLGQQDGEMTLCGYPVVVSDAVPDDRVRVIPDGVVDVIRDERGRAYVWPRVTVKRETYLQTNAGRMMYARQIY